MSSTISNQTIAKCQSCGQLTNFADQPHYVALQHKIAVLSKAAQDAALALDWIKNEIGVDQEKTEEITGLVNRVHAAYDQLNNVDMPDAILSAQETLQ